jgi:hypothetical protein
MKDVKVFFLKESLDYEPKKSESLAKERVKLQSMIEIGHSVFHKFGR